VVSVLVLAVVATLSVIEWGFRYYALAGVLAASAAVNIIEFLRKKTRPELRRIRIIRKTAVMLMLILLASLPTIIFPEYKLLPTTGEYQIKTEIKYFTDESRVETYNKQGGARMLVVEFWHPVNAEGRFPLVVFSHGSFGIRSSNETLFRELASHGYIVCSIDHTYQCFYTTDKDGNTLLMDGGYANEIRRENAREDKQNSLALYRKWMGIRVADINFVIDTIQSDSTEEFYRLIDTKKTGVIGHSLGGSAALGVGRVRDDIGAVIALEAPFMCDILNVENETFVFESAEYPVPVLNVYSDSSWVHLDEWPQYAENARLLTNSNKNAYNHHIAGVGHLSLTDLSLASPLLTHLLNGNISSVSTKDCLAHLNKICLVFFDCFLKDNEPFDINSFTLCYKDYVS
jgi:dienelactone hydrolase